MDRIDLVVNVGRIDHDKLLAHHANVNSQHLAAQNMIFQALNTQPNRYKSSVNNNIHNSGLASKAVSKQLVLSPAVKQLLSQATERLNLSARGFFKVIKVARTIADIEGSVDITTGHLADALLYRLTVV